MGYALGVFDEDEESDEEMTDEFGNPKDDEKTWE
jgi:hypothetical protein